VSAWLNQLLANKRLGPPPVGVGPRGRGGTHPGGGPAGGGGGRGGGGPPPPGRRASLNVRPLIREEIIDERAFSKTYP
jgi:hypothetical protein